jgi:HrpA-like RNA helicase
VKEVNALPIVMHERELMENIENFVVTLVCGETGSGKST